MKFAIAPMLAGTLLIAACATSQQQDEPTSASSPATPVTYHYACESGKTIAASYPDPDSDSDSDSDSARVRYQGTTYQMQTAVSGSGARYVADGLEWWTKGSGTGSHGTLFQHNADDTSGKTLASCTVK